MKRTRCSVFLVFRFDELFGDHFRSSQVCFGHPSLKGRLVCILQNWFCKSFARSIGVLRANGPVNGLEFTPLVGTTRFCFCRPWWACTFSRPRLGVTSAIRGGCDSAASVMDSGLDGLPMVQKCGSARSGPIQSPRLGSIGSVRAQVRGQGALDHGGWNSMPQVCEQSIFNPGLNSVQLQLRVSGFGAVA